MDMSTLVIIGLIGSLIGTGEGKLIRYVYIKILG